MAKQRDTKAVLLETALELLWTQSYGGVSVDDICKKAGAKKGSFYHYFSSKAELTIAALEHLWEELRPGLDEIFSPQIAPLERIHRYIEGSIAQQIRLKEKQGHVVGCPLTSIGSEQCSCCDGVSKKAQEILKRIEKYLKSAIQDAVDEGALPKICAERAASRLLTYELGALSLARISDNVEPLLALRDSWMPLLNKGDYRTGSLAA